MLVNCWKIIAGCWKMIGFFVILVNCCNGQNVFGPLLQFKIYFVICVLDRTLCNSVGINCPLKCLQIVARFVQIGGRSRAGITKIYDHILPKKYPSRGKEILSKRSKKIVLKTYL